MSVEVILGGWLGSCNVVSKEWGSGLLNAPGETWPTRACNIEIYTDFLQLSDRASQCTPCDGCLSPFLPISKSNGYLPNGENFSSQLAAELLQSLDNLLKI